MPAYFDAGFSVRQPMWHGLGNVPNEYPVDWDEARKWAGLDWEPEIRDLAIANVSGEWIKAENRVALVRSDNDMLLNVPSTEYVPITHREMGEVLEALIDTADGHLKIETAGSVRDGRSVFALVLLDEPLTVPGDETMGVPTEHLPFVALLNSHDGSAAMRAVNTMVRVVCWNTFQMAWSSGEKSGRMFDFRHTGNVAEKIEDAKLALSGLRADAHAYVAMMTDLVKLNVDDKTVERFLSEFLPKPVDAATVSERVMENIDTARELFRTTYLTAVTTESIRGTGMGLLMTATEYLDHQRAGSNIDTRLGRSILRPERKKAEAVSIIRRVCK
jgi:phage/plasmid-like protein (TIGR03299 family)